MKGLDLVIFLVYAFGMLAIGTIFYRKDRSSHTFILGNQSLPTWAITLSFFATFVSSISFLALPGIAFQSNWNAFVFSLSIPFAAWIAIRFFIPLYRKVNSPSAYTYLEKRFGKWASIYASICYILNQLMRVGTILYLLALALNAIMNWDIAWIIILTGAIVCLYSLLGGIQAVVWTDAVQGILLIAGAMVSLGYILVQMPEGPQEIFTIAFSDNKFSLGSYSLDLSSSTFWVVFVYGLFINLQNYGIDQNYVQRYMACQTTEAAKRSAFWGGFIYLPVSALFLFIGTSLYAFYQSEAGTLPEDLQAINQGDKIFPYFIVHELPPGITGLLIASIFSAGMSTISTSFNSAATVILTNYVHRLLPQRSWTNRQEMRILYIASFLISIVGIGIGLAMINVKSALDTWWKLASVFSGGMLGLFLLGAFTSIRKPREAIIAVVSGLGIILWISLSNVFPSAFSYVAPFHPYLSIVLGTTTIFLIGFLFTTIRYER